MGVKTGIVIKFEPSAKQAEAWRYLNDPVVRYVGYGGSGFSGKSYLECYWLTIMSIGYPGTRWGLARKELSVLRKTTLLTLFKVFGECNILKDRDYVYNAQQHTVTFSNGSIIFLIDTAFQPSDPLYTRFGGLELTGAAVDESAETSSGAIDILFTRIGRWLNHKYNLAPKFLETFNPDKGHVYRRYYKPWKDKVMQDTYRFVKALPTDNPDPGVKAYVEGIMATGTKITIERLIFGNFEYDEDPAALIEYDKIVDMFTNTHVEKDPYRKYITADIARLGGDRIVIIRWYGWYGKVYAYSKMKLDEVGRIIEGHRVDMGIGHSSVLVDADGMGAGVADFMDYKGFTNNARPLQDPNKPYQDGKPNVENFDNLKSQCYYFLAGKTNRNEIWLECAEEHRELISEEFGQIKQKKVDDDRKKGVIPKDKVKELLGRSPDFSDTAMMRAYFDLRPQFEVVAA